MDAKEAWKQCLNIIRENVSTSVYADWFEQIRAVELRDTILTLQVPSSLYCEHLDEHYGEMLNAVLFRVLGAGIKLKYIYKRSHTGDGFSAAESEINASQDTLYISTTELKPPLLDPFVLAGVKQIKIKPNLNDKYTFDEFVPGKSNMTAYQAGRMLVEQHGGRSAFNPLVICGASGLGKTHLSHAIGLAILKHKPDTKVLYVRVSEFMNQFATATRSGQVGSFINFYQNIDVLIFDDLHDLSNGKKSQEVLYNIFDYLHTRGKQLIFTSATRLGELKNIRQDLISRFKWGLTTEVEMPDEAMRLAILKKKAERDEIESIPENVYAYIAKNVTSNVRELEGALINLIAHATAMHCPIDLNFARGILANFITPLQKEDLSLQRIIEIVAKRFALKPDELLSPTRKREIAEARQIAMFLAKKFTKEPYTCIGREFNRNHATVIHACKTIADLCISDACVRNDVAELEEELQQYS